MIDNVEGKPFETRGKMGVSNGGWSFKGRTGDEANRDDGKGVASSSPLEIVLSGS